MIAATTFLSFATASHWCGVDTYQISLSWSHRPCGVNVGDALGATLADDARMVEKLIKRRHDRQADDRDSDAVDTQARVRDHDGNERSVEVARSADPRTDPIDQRVRLAAIARGERTVSVRVLRARRQEDRPSASSRRPRIARFQVGVAASPRGATADPLHARVAAPSASRCSRSTTGGPG
jgi:hypothetical protein